MARRILGPTGSRRRRRFLLGPTLVLTALALFLTAGAQAVHNLNLFELDKNALAGAAPGDDWELIDDGSSDPNNDDSAITSVFITDPSDVDTDSHFTGGLTKDHNDLPQWERTQKKPSPAKDDITDAYAAAYTDPATNDLIFYFGADRFANNGSSQIGFWFFQNRVTLTGGASGTTFGGVHEDGDILVLSDFTQGGAISTINVLKWVDDPVCDPQTNDACEDPNLLRIASSADCSTADPDDDVCAVVNSAVETAPWSYAAKFPADGPDGDTLLDDFPAGSFYEGGINISDLIPGGTGCFSSFLAETRSSPSVDAVLKDFALGEFPLCDARITINPSAVNEVGQAHTFTVDVDQSTGTGFVPATVGNVDVTLSGAGGAAAVLNAAASTCDDNQPSGDNLDANGQCTMVFTSNTAGTVTGHAAVDLNIGGTLIHRETDGTGQNGSDAVKRFVDAQIDLSPLTDTNGITENHTITATVQQDDGLAAGAVGGDAATGFGPAPNGTVVVFSFSMNTIGATFVDDGVDSDSDGISGNDCVTSGGLGTCTIQITSSAAGTVTVHATTTFTISGESVTRQTNGMGNNSGDATKVFVDGTLRWLKHDQDGNLLGGAIFEVCRTHNFDSSGDGTPFDPITPVCVSVTDDTAPDTDLTPGEFQLEDLVLGRYTIDETTPPPGSAGDPSVETVELTVSNPSNADNDPAGETVPIFVNERLYRVIVITCNDSVSPKQLVDSTVTMGGMDFETIESGDSLPAAFGAVDPDELCNLPGATKGGLSTADAFPVTVELPDDPPLFPPGP